MTEGGLSSALFSEVQKKVLALIFGHPDRSYYGQEIIRNVHSGVGAVQRELSRLQQSGLVSVERVGNQKHYRANRQSPIFNELHGLILKTVGLAEPLRRSLAPYADRIRSAFIYGSVAKGNDTAESDIDLMIIGEDLTYSDLFAGLQDAEAILQRPVNPTFQSIADWHRKLAAKDPFVTKVNARPKIFVFGSEKDLADAQRQSRQSGKDREAETGAGDKGRVRGLDRLREKAPR